MEYNKNNQTSSLDTKIETIVKEKKILWQESLKKRESLKKTNSILGPLSIFLLLFIIPVFNIFQIKNSGDFLIGLLLAIFLTWLWYKAFGLFVLNGNIISPWVLGLVDKAKEAESSKKTKGANFFMGVFFVFIGIMFLIAGNDDSVGKWLSFGFGLMFFFLGSIGIINFIIEKTPEKILFLLKNNKKINFLIFIIISLSCFSIIISIFFAFLNQFIN